MVTYHPGYKNVKADMLSCYYATPELEKALEPILQPVLVVAPVMWEFDSQILEAEHAQLSGPILCDLCDD